MPHPAVAPEDALPEILVRYLEIEKGEARQRIRRCARISEQECQRLAAECRERFEYCPPLEFEALFWEGFDELVRRMPGSRLATGQGFTLNWEAGKREVSARIAEDCTASPGWCAMLQGVDAYLNERWDEAAGLYAVAIEVLDPLDACAFTDVQWVLEDVDGYDDIDCADRGPVNDTIWWLADPLWTEPGNSRRLTHWHRVAMTILHDDHLELESEPGSVVDWGEHPRSHHFTTLQSDWYIRPAFGTRRGLPWRGSGLPGEPMAYAFIPDRGAIRAPYEAADSDWRIDSEEPYEVHFAPGWNEFVVLPHQVAAFRRSGEMEIVAAAEIPPASYLMRSLVRLGALVISGGPEQFEVTLDSEGRDRYVFRDTVATGRYVAGIEVLAPLDRTVGRARTGVALPEDTTGLSASDLLLFRTDHAAEPAGDLDSVAPAMIGRTWVEAEEPIGAYWELYGAPDSEPVAVAITAREHRGFFGRLGQSLGIGGDDLVVEWIEGTSVVDGIAPRAVALALDRLEPGTYTIEVELTVAGFPPVVLTRVLEVR